MLGITLNEARDRMGLPLIDARTRGEWGAWRMGPTPVTRIGRWRRDRRRKANAREMVREGLLTRTEADGWLRCSKRA